VFSETADLFENLDALTEKKDFSLIPKTMEEYGQNYGLILYSTVLDAFDNQCVTLQPYKFRDRANFYVDNQWFATFTRDRETIKIADGVQTVDGLPTITQNGSKRKIDVLVENIGRVNYGKEICDERKGLEDAILSSKAKLFGYETRTLPLNDLSKLEWSKKKSQDVRPCFFKGHFEAKSGIDTYVDFSKFGHGYIWINGFNLGRYDSSGPQLTLYVPGGLLRERNNEIIVLDIDPIEKRNYISLLDHEILEGDAADLS
jgi:beta-galactosidase